jgi:hypothetical protein
MQRHPLPILLIIFTAVASLLVAFVPGLQPPSWHGSITATEEMESLPLFNWFATDAEAETEAVVVPH